ARNWSVAGRCKWRQPVVGTLVGLLHTGTASAGRPDWPSDGSNPATLHRSHSGFYEHPVRMPIASHRTAAAAARVYVWSGPMAQTPVAVPRCLWGRDLNGGFHPGPVGMSPAV